MNRFSNKPQHPRGKSGGGGGRPNNNFGPPSKSHSRGKPPQKPRRPMPPSAPRPVNYEETGMEVNYLKELVEAEKTHCGRAQHGGKNSRHGQIL